MYNLHLAVIEILEFCNLRCKHCYSDFKKNTIIGKSDYEMILNQLKALDVSNLVLSGGEPFLLGNSIGDYIITAQKIIKNITITSNGTLIKNIDNKILKDINIQISMDGNREIHDSIRGKGTYTKAINSIRYLVENGIFCSIMMTVSDYNFECVNYVIELANHFSIPLNFEKITNTGRGKKFSSLSIKNFEKLVKIALGNDIYFGEPICSVLDARKREYLMSNKIIGGCAAGISGIAIDSNLNVLPCTRLRLKLGNLKESSLKNILDNSVLFKNIGNRQLLKGKCGSCKYKHICGGCRANSFSNNNDYLGEDFSCFIK